MNFIFILNIFFVFLFGAVWGSFLNVVALRHNSGRGLEGRSSCNSCGETLKWYELVPVFSFLIQKGRCRTCKTKLSWQYLIVEILTGILFLIGYQLFSYQLFNFVVYLIVISLGVILAVYDYRHQILPDKFLLPLILISFASLFVVQDALFGSVMFIMPNWIAVLSGPLIALPFFLIWLVSRGGAFGLGDVKLMLAIGWHLGFLLGVSAVFLSFWLGMAIVFLMYFNLVLIQRKKQILSWQKLKQTAIPFGPFLLIAWLIVYIYSGDLFFFLSNYV